MRFIHIGFHITHMGLSLGCCCLLGYHADIFLFAPCLGFPQPHHHHSRLINGVAHIWHQDCNEKFEQRRHPILHIQLLQGTGQQDCVLLAFFLTPKGNALSLGAPGWQDYVLFTLSPPRQVFSAFAHCSLTSNSSSAAVLAHFS